GPEGHLPGGARLAARRLDRPGAGPADPRRAPVHRRGELHDRVQRAALLPARLALAAARRPPVRARGAVAVRPHGPGPARRRGDHRRARGPRGPRGPPGDDLPAQPARVGAAGVLPPAQLL
ncbi:MAG: hypothetical protein AVDCRST_MAG13-349, partial [uncultured Solirubrobacteraceae bacterium]